MPPDERITWVSYARTQLLHKYRIKTRLCFILDTGSRILVAIYQKERLVAIEG
jgi:hypothetical protein